MLYHLQAVDYFFLLISILLINLICLFTDQHVILLQNTFFIKINQLNWLFFSLPTHLFLFFSKGQATQKDNDRYPLCF